MTGLRRRNRNYSATPGSNTGGGRYPNASSWSGGHPNIPGSGSGGGGSGSSYDATHPRPRAGNEYEDDNVTRLPVDNSILGLRSAQRLARMLQQRSGRGSTRLVNTAGTIPHVASLMGSTQ